MANEVASGLDALVERILSDAKNDADNTMDAAAKEAAAIAARAEQAAEGINLDYKRRAHEAVDSIIERSTTNAQLEGRKLTLTYKRGLLDEAFSLAYERLCKLTGDERKKLLRSLAIREANGGETVSPSKADKELIGALLPEINTELERAGKAPLVLSKETADIDGGILLIAKGYVKSCSFEALLAETRSAEESNVAARLFV